MVHVTEVQEIKNNIKSIILLEWIMLIFSVFLTVATLIWVLWFSWYGIDLTDESFYLVWMSNPFSYSISATQFGFIYHPLYVLLDGNIVALRQANLLITFCLAWGLVNVFLKTIFNEQSLRIGYRVSISAAFAVTSLIWLKAWIPTPGYNSLALQALFIAVTGMLLSEKKTSHASIIGWFLIGFGGWLAFMAKPTTAAALGVLIFFYLWSVGKLNLRLLVMSLVTTISLLILSALIIDGSISGFIERLREGSVVGSILNGGNTRLPFFRIDNFNLSGKAKYFLVIGSLITALVIYLSYTKGILRNYIGISISIIFVLLGLTIILDFLPNALNAGYFQGLLIWVIPYGALLAGLMIYRFKGLLEITPNQWAITFCLLVLPHIYAFGSSNNYWYQGAQAGIFWALAGVTLLIPISSSKRFVTILLSLGFAAQLISIIMIHVGIESPYRQPQPLYENDYKLQLKKQGSNLILSEAYGYYFDEVIDLATKAGFKKGMPVIDLTGQSPGTLYFLDANSIGQAWTIGGYPGSATLAVKMLNKVKCEDIARAWLLVESNGPRKISPEILLDFGVNWLSDFEIVGSFKTAVGAGGYKKIRKQQLLKPVRSIDVATTACTALKTVP